MKQLAFDLPISHLMIIWLSTFDSLFLFWNDLVIEHHSISICWICWYIKQYLFLILYRFFFYFKNLNENVFSKAILHGSGRHFLSKSIETCWSRILGIGFSIFFSFIFAEVVRLICIIFIFNTGIIIIGPTSRLSFKKDLFKWSFLVSSWLIVPGK